MAAATEGSLALGACKEEFFKAFTAFWRAKRSDEGARFVCGGGYDSETNVARDRRGLSNAAGGCFDAAESA